MTLLSKEIGTETTRALPPKREVYLIGFLEDLLLLIVEHAVCDGFGITARERLSPQRIEFAIDAQLRRRICRQM